MKKAYIYKLRALLIALVIIIVAAVALTGCDLEKITDLPGSSSSDSSTTQKIDTTALRALLDIDTFYEGISIEGISLAGLTRAEAAARLEAWEEQATADFKVELTVNGAEKPLIISLTPEQAGLQYNTTEILEQAWATGRQSTAATEAEQLQERYAAVEALKLQALDLKLKGEIDPIKARATFRKAAEDLEVAVVEAKATGFNLEAKKFEVVAGKPGFELEAEEAIGVLMNQLKAGNFKVSGEVSGKVVEPAFTPAELEASLGLVSTAKTLAGSSSSRNRDHNISLIIKGLNGLVLQPGETWSFNEYFGQRTAAKGYKEAPGILNGVTVQELGGGICQPNTTLYQAALMADLEIVERSPHSWPSAYTKIGLDATVSWRAPEFKFRNNTETPIAIVASFSKPNVVVSVYGRKLPEGVSIVLKSEHNGYIKMPETKYVKNNKLAPGTEKVIRQGRRGQKATSYKLWQKDGKTFEKELVAVSTYRAIQGIIEVGPPLPTTAPTTPTAPTEPTDATKPNASNKPAAKPATDPAT